MLNPKLLKVVNHYMKHGSRPEALMYAGYSKTTAYHNPEQVFNRDDVKKEIERRRRSLMEKNELSEDWIVQRLMSIASASLGDLIEFDDEGNEYIDYKKMSPALRSAIGGLDITKQLSGRGTDARPVTKIKVRVADQLRAIEMLGKYLGMFKDKVEVSGDTDLINRLTRARNMKAENGQSSTY